MHPIANLAPLTIQAAGNRYTPQLLRTGMYAPQHSLPDHCTRPHLIVALSQFFTEICFIHPCKNTTTDWTMSVMEVIAAAGACTRSISHKMLITAGHGRRPAMRVSEQVHPRARPIADLAPLTIQAAANRYSSQLLRTGFFVYIRPTADLPWLTCRS